MTKYKYTYIFLLLALLISCDNNNDYLPLESSIEIISIFPEPGSVLSESSIIKVQINYTIYYEYKSEYGFCITPSFLKKDHSINKSIGPYCLAEVNEHSGTVNVEYPIATVWSNENIEHPISLVFEIRNKTTDTTATMIYLSDWIEYSE